MKPLAEFLIFERFNMNWHRLLTQGVIILMLGLLLALASVAKPNVIIMSARFFSWLPLGGIFILSLGILECVDAFLAKEQRDFFQNLQVGALDFIIGLLILLSVAESLSRISMMIAAFLMVRGLVRIALVSTLDLPQKTLTRIFGGISIATGVMLWQQWPLTTGSFVSFCLSIEIAFRGWAMMMFALWVEKQQN
ncbi:MAG: hypothetical protein KAG10_05245 [Methylococcales bacterium]|nr:hypothetical protein [Methylococcales bacterium]MCK5925280.1 hypothetical protein [Methylococcales bacterium]